VARVLTYAVPPSGLGYGEGGVRPFHQDYRHYKYFGFAGRGAKTSWAHNPKYAQTYEHHPSPAAQAAWAAVPPQPDPGPELQPLTPVQLALVGQFSGADVLLDTTDSADELAAREHQQIAAACEQRWTYEHHPSPAAQAAWAAVPPQPDPGPELQPLTPVQLALVGQFRQPAPSDLMLAENPSPHCGSQSPFHQRYKHYKYHGFAGRGASSSWARNPKLALLYDH
ncbi:uncharacterized protein HaLaN_19214, partial [Haematococcus lacustris]